MDHMDELATAGHTGSKPGLTGSRSHQRASPVPLCFDHTQAVATIFE